MGRNQEKQMGTTGDEEDRVMNSNRETRNGTLLQLDHATKRFGAVTAVDDVSLSIEEGQTLGVMGPNGSGKTTLLNLIMGVYPVDEGEIRFGNERISGLRTDEISRRGIGRTYQIPQPFLRMTVLENLVVGDLYGGNHRSLRKARANATAILDRVGLGNKTDLEAGKLGLLDLKRLELARALSLRPRLLLLDEIAAGLVDSEVNELRTLILELKAAGQTMLVIEHILSFIFSVSDLVLVLNFGQRVVEGSPTEITENPTVQEIYLGAEKTGAKVTVETDESRAVTATEPAKILVVDRVNSGYGDFQALFDVSLDIPRGQIVGLIGVNGAGKSTLIRTITRRVPLKSGEIFFNGKSISNTRPFDIIGLGIAQCIEGRKLFPELTVEENLEIGAYCSRARRDRRTTIAGVYELFPKLADRRRQIVSTLSGGEQQMVAIGRALMAKPELIIFDELSLGLAPIVIDSLYGAITKINEQGVTVLLVEQNVHRSLEVADQAYIIERGRIALSGTAAALAENDHVKEAYFGL
jgi:branched-chain amino acid transport system ATP-binding protein